MPLIYNLRQNPFDRCSFDTRFLTSNASLAPHRSVSALLMLSEQTSERGKFFREEGLLEAKCLDTHTPFLFERGGPTAAT
jgi:hypothetical protein